ncbi:MAG: right-handed parallel beta-helix repeat-containing protein [Candidatus Bathyarchaeota archaeon]|nr:right-handed parallel beta-helix repeat-containing protein [Candidatus Bathyarchaeota archaeon]
MALDKKRGFTVVAALLLLLSATAGLAQVDFGNAEYVPWVWHNSRVTILSNGTITPSNTNIQRQDNIYTLKGDLYVGIAILKNDTVFEGNGFRIFGPTYGTGILLQNVTNVTVQNVHLQYFKNGIYLDHANDSTIKENKFTNCGIVVSQNSTNNLIVENTVAREILVEYCQNNVVTKNKVSSITTFWAGNISILDNTVSDSKCSDKPLNGGNYTEGIYIDNSENCVISGNVVERKNVGIDIWQSLNLTLKENTLRNNQVGFKLWGADLQHNLHLIDSSNTVNGKPAYFLVNTTGYRFPDNAGWVAAVNSRNLTVQNWVSTPNWDGVLFVESQDIQIANCNLTANVNAIRLQNVSNCVVNQNIMQGNYYAGLYFEGTTDSVITENRVINNYCFFDVWHNSTGNTFLQNDFVGNWTGPLGKESSNQWDNGEQGNYWGTFTGVDRDHNSISDTAYFINSASGEADRYPLMAPINQMASQQQTQNGDLLLSMPEEYLNYTVTYIDGAAWVKIDGEYPMHLTSLPTDSLPMLYPTPPETVNMHIKLDGVEQSWSNYSEIDPSALHYTDIGSWEMVYCTIKPSAKDFLLEIHYEHPVEAINGSSIFLYDLNISPYLSASSAISTAHFNVQLPPNETDLYVYTTGFEGRWSPINYTSTDSQLGRTVTFDIVSEYGKPLLGDTVFILGDNPIPELTTWAFVALLAAATTTILVLGVKSKRQPMQGSLRDSKN